MGDPKRARHDRQRCPHGRGRRSGEDHELIPPVTPSGSRRVRWRELLGGTYSASVWYKTNVLTHLRGDAVCRHRLGDERPEPVDRRRARHQPERRQLPDDVLSGLGHVHGSGGRGERAADGPVGQDRHGEDRRLQPQHRRPAQRLVGGHRQRDDRRRLELGLYQGASDLEHQQDPGHVLRRQLVLRRHPGLHDRGPDQDAGERERERDRQPHDRSQ